eukprot:gb/GECH01009069.1/.p1 GENE.gb/GECH01009069.1/~~gb/GECH01009069.1/.p1  ORF type:complete len:253 (+),score=47.12 gb/GECH01009069.1/:1-759(+)
MKKYFLILSLFLLFFFHIIGCSKAGRFQRSSPTPGKTKNTLNSAFQETKQTYTKQFNLDNPIHVSLSSGRTQIAVPNSGESLYISVPRPAKAIIRTSFKTIESETKPETEKKTDDSFSSINSPLSSSIGSNLLTPSISIPDIPGMVDSGISYQIEMYDYKGTFQLKSQLTTRPLPQSFTSLLGVHFPVIGVLHFHPDIKNGYRIYRSDQSKDKVIYDAKQNQITVNFKGEGELRIVGLQHEKVFPSTSTTIL